LELKHKLIIGSIAAILLGVAAIFAAWLLRCPTEIEVSIGEFESKQAALPSAIRRLSAEVENCPKAELYRVSWISSDSRMREAVLYIHKTRMLGYEADCYSGFSDRPFRVDDSAIRTVALRGGTLDDVKVYAENNR